MSTVRKYISTHKLFQSLIYNSRYLILSVNIFQEIIWKNYVSWL